LEKIETAKSPGRFYMGWVRRHPMIHMTTKEPAAKTNLVQISLGRLSLPHTGTDHVPWRVHATPGD